MEWIEGSETSDKGFAGQGRWCHWHEMGVAAEENVDDNSCVDREQ